MSLYFKQVLSGKLDNFIYLLGDTDTHECVIVDPAWNVQGLIDLAGEDDMKVTGALVTHYHQDHIGGEIFGLEIEGLAELMTVNPCKVWVNKHEADGVKQITGLSDSDLVKVDGGDSMTVGDLEIQFVHTPGHTPGSQCFVVDGKLVSGDTLFIGSCGRVDLPGGDAEQLYYSLTQKLATMPPETVLYPGHNYGGSSSTMGRENATNRMLQMPNLESWLALWGQ